MRTGSLSCLPASRQWLKSQHGRCSGNTCWGRWDGGERIFLLVTVPCNFQEKWCVSSVIGPWFPIRHELWCPLVGDDLHVQKMMLQRHHLFIQMFVHEGFLFEWTINHVFLARKLHSESGLQPSKYLLAQWNKTNTLFAETYSCFILQ